MASGPTNPETAKRRLAFQKSYSLEHGGLQWRRKSLIDDAKFETITNVEFEKQERHLSHNGSISEDDVFEITSSVDDFETFALVMTLRDGIVTLGRILKTCENSKVAIRHIETRSVQKSGQIQVFLRVESTKEHITHLVKTLRQGTAVTDVNVANDNESHKRETWIPLHISDLDKCNHIITKFEPELDSDHPGFHDKGYRKRRQQTASLAFEYRHGKVIHDVIYTKEETETWGASYRMLKNLFPTHACKEHIAIFETLEKEGIYSEYHIPQLEEVSTFLKRSSGFQIRPVSGLLSARDFLASLSFRVFQCTQYVRHHSMPMHSPEPDCIHELLGHVPMLAIPSFAQFSQEIGLASLGASDEDIEKFATIYWFTVEFGLCKQDGQTRAYGAGLLSSYGELMHALSDKPEHRPFEPSVTALQEYQDLDYQPIYFVAESFDNMKEKVRSYSASIKRPFEYRFDPYTQTVHSLDNRSAIKEIARVLKGDLNHLYNALQRLELFSVNT